MREQPDHHHEQQKEAFWKGIRSRATTALDAMAAKASTPHRTSLPASRTPKTPKTKPIKKSPTRTQRA